MALKPEFEPVAREALKKLPLFGGCGDDQIAALAGRMTGPREVAAGKIIMMDQEIGKTLYILTKGLVSIWKRVGGEKKKLATLPAPNFFGERTMFEESPASASVKADEACTLYLLERSEFYQGATLFPRMSELIHINMDAVRAQRMGPVRPVSDEPAS